MLNEASKCVEYVAIYILFQLFPKVKHMYI